MGVTNYKPLKTAFSRTFLIEGRARGDHRPQYMSQFKMTGLSQDFGDVTPIEMPDPNEYGKFVEVDRVRGSSGRATTSLVGRYAAAIKSIILRLGNQGCPVDLQLHIGECTDPSDFNTLTKGVILEDVLLTNFSTEDIGALSSDEQNPVNETAEISTTGIYEIVPLSFTRKADDIVTNEVIDVALYDTASCGDCEIESDGCQDIFAITKQEGGSPGTAGDVVFSLDGADTWAAHDIDTLGVAEDPTGVAGVGDYVVVTSDDSNSIHIALISEFRNDGDPVFVEVTTGFVGAPNDIWSIGRQAFIVGDSGYVYFLEDPASGVEVLDAGAATISMLIAVHAIDEENAIAVGEDGVVLYTANKVDWTALTTAPIGIGTNFQCAWMKNQKEWWLGDDAGDLWYTLDAGATWTEKALPGTAPTMITDIQFATNSIAYVSAIVGGAGRMYRSYDGGYSWTVLPENVGSIPPNDSINAITTCEYNPDLVVGVGLHEDGTDGIIVVGRE